jgi:hypothetical protein
MPITTNTEVGQVRYNPQTAQNLAGQIRGTVIQHMNPTSYAQAQDSLASLDALKRTVEPLIQSWKPSGDQYRRILEANQLKNKLFLVKILAQPRAAHPPDLPEIQAVTLPEIPAELESGLTVSEPTQETVEAARARLSSNIQYIMEERGRQGTPVHRYHGLIDLGDLLGIADALDKIVELRPERSPSPEPLPESHANP